MQLMRVILCVFVFVCVSMSAFYGCSAAFTSCEDFKIAARCSKSSAGGGFGSYSGEGGSYSYLDEILCRRHVRKINIYASSVHSGPTTIGLGRCR